MVIIEVIFWISAVVIFYCYAGYGLILYAFNSIKSLLFKSKPLAHSALPEVSIIIPAWNEDDVLEQKIINTIGLNYPPGKLTVICITDGSDDNSVSLVQKYPHIKLLHIPERQGKVAAINRAMRLVNTPIVFFSDANALLNKSALVNMVAHFSDKHVGGVAGEKKVLSSQNSPVGKAERLYWQYESFLKKQDAAFHSVVGAAGELFAIRTSLWQSLDEKIILDDFIISMQVRLLGYRFAYEPSAFSVETASQSFAEEKKRKTRIAAGAFQSMNYINNALNCIKHPALCFQFFSRRILRWFVAPILLPVLFITSFLLLMNDDAVVYLIVFTCQMIFYFAALSAFILNKYSRLPGWFNAPLYFVFMNSCLVSGSMLYFKNNHSVLWNKSLRESFE